VQPPASAGFDGSITCPSFHAHCSRGWIYFGPEGFQNTWTNYTPAASPALSPSPFQVPSPAPPSVTIVQAVVFSNLEVVAYVGNVKLTYETGYAMGLGLYDQAAKAMHTGCTISSEASAARRVGISVTFTAVASGSRSSAAEAAANDLDAATLLQHLVSANRLLAHAVTLPTATQIAVSDAIITQTATNDEEDWEKWLWIGCGVLGGLVVLGILIALLVCLCSCLNSETDRGQSKARSANSAKVHPQPPSAEPPANGRPSNGSQNIQVQNMAPVIQGSSPGVTPDRTPRGPHRTPHGRPQKISRYRPTPDKTPRVTR